jgi:hypothetical protein
LGVIPRSLATWPTVSAIWAGVHAGALVSTAWEEMEERSASGAGGMGFDLRRTRASQVIMPFV